jgi:lipopolysaccharide export system permease protein
MVKFNEIVSFYSLGFSPKKLLKPFMFLGLSFFALFMFLDSGKFAYVNEYANAILNKNNYSSNNLFLKYNDKIIYIKKIRPILKEAENLKVFVLDKNTIKKIIVAKKAKFKDDVWIAKKAEITLLSADKITHEVKDIKILKGFKPKIISNLKNLNSISLYDAYIAIKLFNDVNINTLLSIVFYKIFTALSLIFIIFVLMFKIPLHSRISNVSLFLVKSTFLTILIWGSDLMIYKFAKQGVVSPYLLALPFFVIFIYGLYLYYKEK